MTTAPVSAPAQIASTGRPTRKQPAPTRQRISTTVLAIGTVLSLGSLAGPDWALRAGVAVALVSAVVSCALAWRELYLTKRRHAQDLLAVGRRHTEHLRAEREHNADVLTTVSGRAHRWRQEVDRQQAQIAELRVESGALRSDLSAVRRHLAQANGAIAGLRETVRERDLEIALLRSAASGADASGADAEVHGLPRRVRLERAGTTVPTGGDGRTVVDFRAEVPALPNFETDRREA